MTVPIYFGTLTGNAEHLAKRLVKCLQACGVEAEAQNLAELEGEALVGVPLACFIVSTWGEGEPPDECFDFWEEFCVAPLDLSGLQYALYGLGDRSYADFNAFGRELDERLTELGAKRVLPRVEADVDYEAEYPAWETAVKQLLQQSLISR